MCHTADWPIVRVPADLSDEAAAQVAELLMDLALWFENTHFSQIHRHHQAVQPPSDYDPSQLELFDPF